jgi:hypothetical protein
MTGKWKMTENIKELIMRARGIANVRIWKQTPHGVSASLAAARAQAAAIAASPWCGGSDGFVTGLTRQEYDWFAANGAYVEKVSRLGYSPDRWEKDGWHIVERLHGGRVRVVHGDIREGIEQGVAPGSMHGVWSDEEMRKTIANGAVVFDENGSHL